MKPGEVMRIEPGTEVTVTDKRVRITTELQRSASRQDIAAHLRAVAGTIERLT
jgi:hypothetical protein